MSCSPTRSRRASRRAAATSSTKQLYSADAQNFTAEVNKVAASKPDAVVLVAFDETKKIIPQLIAKGVGPQDQQTYFVDGNTADYSGDFAKGTLKGVKATYPGAELTGDFKQRMLKTDPKLNSFTYGPEWYDATVLTALAATEAKTDDPTTFAPDIIKVSKDGTKCSTLQGLRRPAEEGRGHRLRRRLRSLRPGRHR